MLEVLPKTNTWTAPDISYDAVSDAVTELNISSERTAWLHFVTTKPYIDMLYVELRDPEEDDYKVIRFTFHEGLYWSHAKESQFEKKILNSEYPLRFKSEIFDGIYEYYSKANPQWHLKRYYNHEERMLDHIHHCMTRDTIKELLYKAGVDELAVRAPKAHEINLLASSPSEIYDNVPMRVIRAINNEYGAMLLAEEDTREFLKKLSGKYPDIFKTSLNDAQCEYLMRLQKGDLTYSEIYRLFMARKQTLSSIWLHAQFVRYMQKESHRDMLMEQARQLVKVDPFYKDYINKIDRYDLSRLVHYLLVRREELDRDIRRSNRKRDYEWQERDYGFVVRYPQTINDFCKEATYMSNCLLTYLQAYIENDTTILLIRRYSDIYQPYITMEVYKDKLVQAFHRFNRDCDDEEAAWIRNYCDRHGIDHSDYYFDVQIDLDLDFALDVGPGFDGVI